MSIRNILDKTERCAHLVSGQNKMEEQAAAFPAQFNYDGVTAALKVNANLHDPLLCVTGTFDVASGDLSLPGRVLR
ncbi:hypothetical protein F0U60_33270 [Archangium minus]|uniref:Uncharacterized protein n=1 Tax=Archangium minus TaxID=83450 RepID=A0ABY9WZ90_9BACT|nr:hypothetical protein F0U60_33270 [Archangium minus]